MKLWQVTLCFLASLTAMIAFKVASRLEVFETPEFFVKLASWLTGIFLLLVLLLLAEKTWSSLGLANVGEEQLSLDKDGLYTSQMRFRRTIGYGSCAMAVLFLYSGFGTWFALSGVGVRLLFVFGGLIFLWGGIFWLIYRIAYDGSVITVTTLLLSKKTHEWKHIERTSRSLTDDGTYLHFAKSGKGFISEFAIGSDEVLSYAQERLNHARTPRS